MNTESVLLSNEIIN